MDSRQNGFTLMELLVALAIFAVMATLAFGGLGEAVVQSERLEVSQQRWTAVQRAVRILENDFAQLRARPVRDILGQDYRPALEADRSGEFSLTRGGWLNPAQLPRAELQRLRYRLLDGRLLREHWPALDRIGATQPVGEVLLADVSDFRVEFLPARGSVRIGWAEFWPQPGDRSIDKLPAGVRLTLTLQDLGQVVRLIEVGS